MNNIIFIAFRNFIRQRRRNLMLGGAIAFGIMVLTIALAFTAGLTDTILNRIVIYMSGHIQVNIVEQGRFMTPVIRDKERFIAIVSANVTDIDYLDESLGGMCRVVGNGKGDYAYLVGVDANQEFTDSFQLIAGSYQNYHSPAFNNPVLLSSEKAKALKVKVGDAVRIRLSNIYGQSNTAALTVAGIMKSQSMWMDWAIFTPRNVAKAVMGYQPHETGSLRVILKKPKTSATQADKLWDALQPHPANIEAVLQIPQQKGITPDTLILPWAKNISASVLCPSLSIADSNWTPENKGVVISSILAQQLMLKSGDEIELSYQTKYLPESAVIRTKINAIATYPTELSAEIIWLNNDDFFKVYNYQLPLLTDRLNTLLPVEKTKSLRAWIAPEWILLPRTRDTDTSSKKMKNITKNPQLQPITDVATMYELASMIVNMEGVLNIAALIAASILLIIIMVGVLNSLRMTIRERTQEIGSMRAIGIKRSQIKWMFLWEAVFLAITGWIMGTAPAFVVMKLLSMIQFAADNPMNMIMADRHLYFLPSFWHIATNFGLLLIFMLITAYGPASQAAKLSPANAFRQGKG